MASDWDNVEAGGEPLASSFAATPRRRTRRRNADPSPRPRKAAVLALGVVAVGLGGGLFLAESSHGGYSLFQATTPSIAQPLSSGTVALSLSGNGSSDSLSVGASNLVPGDTVSREVVVKNTGTVPLTLSFSITPSTSNALVTDPTDGLQVQVQQCQGGGWSSASLPDGGYSYSCSGTASNVVTPGPVGSFSSEVAIGQIGQIPAGQSIPLVLTVSLPGQAGNQFQGLGQTLTYTFVGTQVPGGAA